MFLFAVSVLQYLPGLPKSPEFSIIRYQLSKSATSSGANYEESQAGSSKADFNNKVRIALREIRKSNYLLRIIKEILDDKRNINELDSMIGESNQLKKILGAIVSKTRSKD